VDEELKPSGTPPTGSHLEAAAATVARRAAGAQLDGRMPAIYLGHGAPPLVDDASGSPSSAPGLAPCRDPRRSSWSRPTGRRRRSPGRHQRRRAADLRLLRLSRALLPRVLPGAGGARTGRRVRELLGAGEQVAEAARARPRPRRLRAAARHVSARPTCRCCRSRCPRSSPAGLLELGARLAAAARRGRAGDRQRLSHPRPAVPARLSHRRAAAGLVERVRPLGGRGARTGRHRQRSRTFARRPAAATPTPPPSTSCRCSSRSARAAAGAGHDDRGLLPGPVETLRADRSANRL
jgi:hypothetical protein